MRLCALILLVMLLAPGLAQGEEMRVVQAEEILGKIERGEPVEYNHVIVRGDLDLSKIHLLTRHIDRIGYKITSLILSETAKVVESPIKITNSEIHGTVDFRNSILARNIDFSSTNVSGDVVFRGSRFSRNANFRESRFGRNADFGGSQFSGIADFEWSQFSSYAYFRESQFSEIADFGYAQFNRIADFEGSQFSGIASFWRSQFSENADFWGSEFSGVATFWQSRFSEDVDFQTSQFSSNAYFRESQFSKESDFVVTWYDIKDHLICEDPVYQLLIKTFKSQGLFDEADDCYYQRMENLPIRSPSDWLLRSLAWATCGYGVRPWRTLGLSAVVIVLFGLVYWIGGGIHKSNSQQPDPKKANHPSPKDLLNHAFWDYPKKALAELWKLLRHPVKSARYALGRTRSILGRLDLLLTTPTCLSPGDALYFSTLVFFVSLPPPPWNYRGRWRYLVVIEDILGWMLMTLFVVTLGNVMIR